MRRRERAAGAAVGLLWLLGASIVAALAIASVVASILIADNLGPADPAGGEIRVTVVIEEPAPAGPGGPWGA